MTLAALETSTRRPSVAVSGSGRTLVRTLSGDRAHASDLVPALDELLSELDLAPSSLAGVLVGTGPGSYTGLRVGIATARGLARSTGALLRGVPSGEALAFERLEPGDRCIHLLDARGGELCCAVYERLAEEVRVASAPRTLTPAELADWLPSSLPIYGERGVADAASLSEGERARFDDEVPPGAGALLVLGRRRLDTLGGQAAHEVEPLYLRPFAARARRR
ncbi:MAG: tRNA (adenosine(37)-N6)-threonylcarbamoyltransferase complex dimerization subunit type 1 TsaB [Planctomycetota bacterium]|jgi:tRNA threonylcarbamoyladenosine biosynthesis protein TsaB|nr:tRNA (adenosine(37)-N6)-threonylcarbamoyltransferase complex dimerization subunit type 1 TsaB [Planctomycetota bacterium]MDP6763405.1 tRNA (adenosine(37)-N6)-threonylcarbamoyltransferase complex dimerization subunit type 1 TsaB [Planctomycetota bacterium]MDP6989698.1 tRNA (adenosine(37)-N6)-threonylcarbamoyltransferase complex dimerization subunit type 1 TsaB [Planctomycetota bacterium]